MTKFHRPDRRGSGRGGRSNAPHAGARPPQAAADTDAPRRAPAKAAAGRPAAPPREDFRGGRADGPPRGRPAAASAPGKKGAAPRGRGFDKPQRERDAGPPRDGRRPDGPPQGKPYRARPNAKPPGRTASERPSERPGTDRSGADRPAPQRLRSERSSGSRPPSDRPFEKPRGKRPAGPPRENRRPDARPPARAAEIGAKETRAKPPRQERLVDQFPDWAPDDDASPTRVPSRPAAARSPAAPRSPVSPRSDDDLWVYGNHATAAALANPRRRIRRLVALADAAAGLNASLAQAQARLPIGPLPEILSREELEDLLPPGAVHQGVALAAAALPPGDIEDIIAAVAEPGGASQIVVLLDQVTDPHNIGAVLRSAAAFGALALVLPEHGAPEPTGTLAKAASGALELVPLVRVVNLARTLDRLKEAGFWCVGLDEAAPQTLAESHLSGRIALVLGAEGEGMRRLTRERCDILVRLPTQGALASLNVSNAAAIALYELTRG